ncbi:MAG: preprotein translocase subunit SecA, partial [Pyrinomonadaceae bacterium]
MAVNSFADKIVKKLFGSSSDIFLKNVKPILQEINDWEPKIEKLSDDELKAQTPKFKEIIVNALEGIDDKEERRKAEQEILREILPEAFATVREGSRRVTGMRHFDVQMIGGVALHQGRIA